MAIPLLFLLLLSLTPPSTTATTTHHNHYSMLSTLKIFIYPHNNHHSPPNFTTPQTSLFHHTLLTSNFITTNPTTAHLFYLPFSPQSTTRSVSHLIQHIRLSHPFWNRSLGADHFFLSPHGLPSSSTRNVVELKKNAIQISCFPTHQPIIPHKDITLPPPPLSITNFSTTSTTRHRNQLGYWRFTTAESTLINSLRDHPDFLIESEPSDEVSSENFERSKFCLFVHDGEMLGLSEALKYGCVPVVITDRPIQDLPLMDLIQWSKIALFVGSTMSGDRLKVVMNGLVESGEYERMKGLGVAAAHHMMWNVESQPLDAFHSVMYQLWMRRHSIKYGTWEGGMAAS